MSGTGTAPVGGASAAAVPGDSARAIEQLRVLETPLGADPQAAPLLSRHAGARAHVPMAAALQRLHEENAAPPAPSSLSPGGERRGLLTVVTSVAALGATIAIGYGLIHLGLSLSGG